MTAPADRTLVARRRALLLAPFGACVLAGAGFFAVLGRMKAGHFDPHEVPSQLIGKRIPDFSLPGLDGGAGFGSADAVALGRPLLINFFASWCVPCVVEAPVLMDLKQAGLPIWGIAYKDSAAATRGFLAQRGDPYARLAADQPGRVAIDWGVYGVPESYLLDRGGVVRWRMAGPITPDIAEGQLQPLLKGMA